MRVATIDIGTNTVLLLIAELGPSGQLVVVHERATITRLGEGVDRFRKLSPEAVRRTRLCLDEYASLVTASAVDRVAVVGTSAMRDAAGGESLRVHVRSAFGVEVQVLSGEEEAQLTFRGALSGLPLDDGGEVAVIDIGGGSTEVVIGQGGPRGAGLRFARSFDIGSVRLTERLVAHDPPIAAELDALRRVAAETFEPVPPFGDSTRPVGVAGTVTTLAAVAFGVVPYDPARLHGSELSYDTLRAIVSHLGSIDVEARRKVPGMEPKRADVIVAGGIVVLALLEHWRARALMVSDRGVRWGLADNLVREAQAHAP